MYHHEPEHAKFHIRGREIIALTVLASFLALVFGAAYWLVTNLFF